jgi:predicted ATPase
MITRVANDKHVPAPVLEQLVANTDGNPLFVEELTKMVLESGVLRETKDGYEVADGPLTLAIPTTLHDSLIARLDRLGSAKVVAQVAAILGRTFPYELLQAVSPADTPTLEDALGRLVEAGLLYQYGPIPLAKYQFKHALVQEAAYQSLLRSTRQQTHQRVAQALAEKFPEIAETQPELVAHHYTEAGLGAQAIPYWQRAGQRAVERSAYREAIAHLTKGLGLLSHLPEGPPRIQLEIALQITLGAPLMAVRGYTAQDVEKVFGRARELCRQIGETPQLFTALRGLRQFYQIRGDSQGAYELGEQLLRLAEHAQDSSLLMEAHNALGGALYWMGDFGRAHEHFERVIPLYDPRQHRSDAYLYANDPGVIAYSYTIWTLWYLGFADQSLQRLEKALALSRELAHPFSLAGALAYGAGFFYFRREGPATQELAEQVIAISNEHGFPFWLAMGITLRGWALAERGQVAEGIAQLRQGLAAWRAGGTELARPAYLVMLAHALARGGQLADAFAALGEALATVSERGDCTYEAVEVYHLKGELLLAEGERNDTEAAACLRHALDLARRQGAKSWELRTTITLSRMLQRQGKRAEAHGGLTAIYGWFTEGLDTPDAQAARALLQQLA